jgi:CheY-like chemotaxis protein
VRVQTFQSEGALCLRVADNGPGVPPELAERIFDPFFTTKSEGAGTGVGLSVCRAVLREHGGSLILEGVGSGASFLASIPITSLSAGEAAPTDALRQEARAGWALVVDDEAEVADLLGDILESAGFSTVRFGNGRDALAWIETHPCDLVLSDIRMPDMDGPALWRALKERRPELARRMAFITGDTLSAGVAAFLQETGLPGLEKPFTPEDVLSVVARIETV